jgi:ABC-type spermidine/putrescine transport system permease subunit I
LDEPALAAAAVARSDRFAARASALSRTRTSFSVGLLVVPALAFMALFYLYPLSSLIEASLRAHEGDPGLSLDHYLAATESRRVMAALARTIWLSLVTTLLALVISYPIALYLIGAGQRLRTGILIFTFVSLAASLIVRNYGWLVVLADAGPVNRLLLALGLADAPVRLVYSEGAILVALVHYALPFMVLPIYGALVRLQPSTWEAAQALGASPWTTLRTVILPLSMPGVYGGVTLTFAIATSAYVTPLMLGAPSTAFISQVAADELLVQLNFGGGGAIIIILTLCTFAIVAAYTMAVRRIGRSDV